MDYFYCIVPCTLSVFLTTIESSFRSQLQELGFVGTICSMLCSSSQVIENCTNKCITRLSHHFHGMISSFSSKISAFKESSFNVRNNFFFCPLVKKLIRSLPSQTESIPRSLIVSKRLSHMYPVKPMLGSQEMRLTLFISSCSGYCNPGSTLLLLTV